MSRIRVILFDAVGTLIYPSPSAAEVYHRVGQRHGSALSLDSVQRRFRQSYETVFGEDADVATDERTCWHNVVAQVFREIPDHVDTILSELWNHFAESSSWCVYDDVQPVWTRLTRAGLQLGIASNFDERLSEICAELRPLTDADPVFYSSEIGARKPHPRFFLEAQRRLGFAAAEILLVGDDPRADVEGARAAGWHAVLLDRSSSDELPRSIGSLDKLTECLSRRAIS